MKYRFRTMAAIAAVVMMSACSSAPAADKPAETPTEEESGFTAAIALQDAFSDNGFTVADIADEEAKDVKFTATNDMGGSNVAISQYDDGAQAQNVTDDKGAQFTQEDYYSNKEINNDEISLSTFTNSINNNEAVLVLLRKDNIVIEVSEIASENMDDVMKALAAYNPAIVLE